MYVGYHFENLSTRVGDEEVDLNVKFFSVVILRSENQEIEFEAEIDSEDGGK